MKKIIIYYILFVYSLTIQAQITGSIIQPTNCTSTNGAINLIVKGGRPPYSFSWSNGASTADLTNLSFGEYCVIVSDAFCCEASTCFDVQPAVSPSDEKPYIKEIEIVFRGVTIYKGGWVLDASGCVRFNDIIARKAYNYASPNDKFDVIVTFNKPMNSSSSLLLSQNGVLGAAKITNAPNNTIFRFSQVALQKGSFVIGGTNVTDLAGNLMINMPKTTSDCVKIPTKTCIGWSNPDNIADGSEDNYDLHCPIIILTVGASISHVTSCNPPNGEIKFSSFSTLPKVAITSTFELLKQNQQGGHTFIKNLDITSSNPPVATGLAQGLYLVSVTDNNTGCKTESSLMSVELRIPEIKTEFQNIERPCNGQNNGQLKIVINQPITGNFSFKWSNSPAVDVGRESVRSNLAEGTYSVIITGTNGCTKEVSYTLTSASTTPIAVNVDMLRPCKNEKNGRIAVHATGGGGAYTFQWFSMTPGGTGNNNIREELAEGIYTFVVTDKCGQTLNGTYDLRYPLLANQITTQGLCSAATFTANPSQGNLPYKFLWSNDATTQIASNFSQAVCVTVTDANDCTVSTCIAPSTITPSFEIITSDPCQADQSGIIEIKIHNPNLQSVSVNVLGIPQAIPPISAIMTVKLTNLSDGLYPITVNVGGCQLSTTKSLVKIPTIKKLNKNASSFSDRSCIYDEFCGNTLITTKRHEESGKVEDFSDPNALGSLRCRYRVLCPNLENGGDDESIGAKSALLKVARHAEIEAIANKILESDPQNQNALRYLSGAAAFGYSPCDRVSYCPINLRVWMHSSITPVKEEQIAGTDCTRYKCKAGLLDFTPLGAIFLKRTFTVCKSSVNLPPGYIYNPQITNCNPNSFNVYQLILWRKDLEKITGFSGSSLDLFLKNVEGNADLFLKSKCAKVIACVNTFEMLFSDISFVNCYENQIPPVLVANLSPCIPNATGDRVLCGKFVKGCPTCGTSFDYHINIFTKDFAWYKKRPLKDPNDNGFYVISGKYKNTKFGKLAYFYDEEGYISPKGVFYNTEQSYLCDYDPNFYDNSNLMPLDSIKFALVDATRSESVDITEHDKGKSYFINFANLDTEIEWSTLISSTIGLNIKDVKKNQDKIEICGTFEGELRYNGIRVKNLDQLSAFTFSINSENVITNMNFMENIDEHKTISFYNSPTGGWGIAAYSKTNNIRINSFSHEVNTDELLLFDGILRKITTGIGVKAISIAQSGQNNEVAIACKGAGDVILNGITYRINPNQLLILSINENGEKKWKNVLEYANDVDENIDIVYNDDNQLYLGATFENNILINSNRITATGGNDIAIFKFNSDGNIASYKNYGSLDDENVSKLFYNKGVLYFGGEQSGETQERIIGKKHFLKFSENSSDAYMSFVLETDFDEILNSSIIAKTTFEAQIQPNPFDNNIYINIKCLDNCSYNIKLFNIFGRELWQSNFDAAKGENLFRIDKDNLLSGAYLVEIIDSEGKKKVLKAIKN
jgi:hypothetical protein